MVEFHTACVDALPSAELVRRRHATQTLPGKIQNSHSMRRRTRVVRIESQKDRTGASLEALCLEVRCTKSGGGHEFAVGGPDKLKKAFSLDGMRECRSDLKG